MKPEAGAHRGGFRWEKPMPLWVPYRLTGLLRPLQQSGRDYALEMDDGGVWQLDFTHLGPPCHLSGLRVIVEGVRIDFDLLDVTRIDALQ